jgi:heme/copper-type cytochrome/quinol oxidase subunit 1
MENLSLRFVRWGTGLMILGLLTGYGPLGHYLSSGVEHACPWAPVHGHTALLGWIGMTIFGLVYRAIPSWSNGRTTEFKLGSIQFYLSVIAVLGVYANGIFGYRILDRISPDFFYIPNKETLNLWLTIDGIFLSLYGVGCLLFLVVLMKSTAYKPKDVVPL